MARSSVSLKVRGGSRDAVYRDSRLFKLDLMRCGRAEEGDWIDADELLCVLETAKLSVDIRSSASGKIVKLPFKAGDTVAVGQELAQLDTKAARPAGGAAPAPKPAVRVSSNCVDSTLDRPLIVRVCDVCRLRLPNQRVCIMFVYPMLLVPSALQLFALARRTLTRVVLFVAGGFGWFEFNVSSRCVDYCICVSHLLRATVRPLAPRFVASHRIPPRRALVVPALNVR